jgi:hypothetical protein
MVAAPFHSPNSLGDEIKERIVTEVGFKLVWSFCLRLAVSVTSRRRNMSNISDGISTVKKNRPYLLYAVEGWSVNLF